MARVLLENITKKYGDVTAVNDLNMEARDKEFLVLVGPSGCGKSTALRMIAGLAIWAFDLSFYNSAFGEDGLLGPLGSIFICYVGIVWLQTISYAWALLVSRDDLRLLQLLRNGALITLRYPFHNLISTLFIGALFVLGIYFPPLYVLVIPPLVALLALHNTYLLAPELVPEDSEALSIVS